MRLVNRRQARHSQAKSAYAPVPMIAGGQSDDIEKQEAAARTLTDLPRTGGLLCLAAMTIGKIVQNRAAGRPFKVHSRALAFPVADMGSLP